MTKIKICGLFRDYDVEYANNACPDFCGFITGVPSSRRNIPLEQAQALREKLRPEIVPVCVFVDAPQEKIRRAVDIGAAEAVQLHGTEDEAYIQSLKSRIHVPVIKAFCIQTKQDLQKAAKSSADFILLDSGAGTGKIFDWGLLQGFSRPYFLAGGLTPENLPEAIATLSPWGVDLSSGVESGGVKDNRKIQAAVAAVRSTK